MPGACRCSPTGFEPRTPTTPRGYYELEALKKLKEDTSCLDGARGHVIKAVSMLLYDLPPRFSYRVVFMLRNLDEVLASQKEMMKRRGTLGSGVDDRAMRVHFETHLQKLKAWLAGRPNFSVLYCDYGDLLRDPGNTVRRIDEFLGGGLDQGTEAMGPRRSTRASTQLVGAK